MVVPWTAWLLIDIWAALFPFCEASFAGLSAWLTAVALFTQILAAAWLLAQAAEERQHEIPHCPGLHAAFQAPIGPISTH
jgi:hypothetical protein